MCHQTIGDCEDQISLLDLYDPSAKYFRKPYTRTSMAGGERSEGGERDPVSSSASFPLLKSFVSASFACDDVSAQRFRMLGAKVGSSAVRIAVTISVCASRRMMLCVDRVELKFGKGQNTSLGTG